MDRKKRTDPAAMTKVYVVVGMTGEYEDRDAWNVAAYPDRDVAELHAKMANDGWIAERDRVYALEGYDFWGTDDKEEFLKTFPWDRGGLCSYTDNVYKVIEVPFCLHPDQYIDMPREDE